MKEFGYLLEPYTKCRKSPKGLFKTPHNGRKQTETSWETSGKNSITKKIFHMEDRNKKGHFDK